MKNLTTITIQSLGFMLFISTICLTGCKQQSSKNKPVLSSTSSGPKIEMDIHGAALIGNVDIIKEHIKAGTDINTIEPSGGSTPLISAAVFGNTEVALELIKAGADINFQNNDGSTALHSAAFFCRTEIVEALIANGADKTIRNKTGATAEESVSGNFKQVKGIYDFFGSQLGPLGLKLDYDHIKKERPIIANLLKK